MMIDDNDGQMIFGDLGGLKLPEICLTGEENPEKTSARKLVPTGDRTRARCVIGAHATTWPTAVIIKKMNKNTDTGSWSLEDLFDDSYDCNEMSNIF